MTPFVQHFGKGKIIQTEIKTSVARAEVVAERLIAKGREGTCLSW